MADISWTNAGAAGYAHPNRVIFGNVRDVAQAHAEVDPGNFSD